MAPYFKRRDFFSLQFNTSDHARTRSLQPLRLDDDDDSQLSLLDTGAVDQPPPPPPSEPATVGTGLQLDQGLVAVDDELHVEDDDDATLVAPPPADDQAAGGDFAQMNDDAGWQREALRVQRQPEKLAERLDRLIPLCNIV